MPILITLVVCLYLIAYAFAVIFGMGFSDSLILRGILFLVGLGSIGFVFTMLSVLFKRLREIREEEDDDISKY